MDGSTHKTDTEQNTIHANKVEVPASAWGIKSSSSVSGHNNTSKANAADFFSSAPS